MAKRPATFTDEVVSGDHARALAATRDLLAVRIAVAEPRETAPLVNQLRATLAELAELGADEEASVVDDLASRRADRRPKATGS